MQKHPFDPREEPDFSVGFPLGVIIFMMLAITVYLAALEAQIPPPRTNVYLASDR
ncbi:hypothetical protein NN6n1_42500 [Shinella zoogloeoides]